MRDFERTMNRLIHRLSASDQREIRQSIAEGFGQNFENQSAGSGSPWAALRPATILDRERKGFPGSRPILERTGNYRSSLEDLDDPDHYSLSYSTDTSLYLEEASNSPLYGLHEGGRGRVPARPAGELGPAAESALGVTVDRVMEALLNREGL
jgi:hypothetical protein